MNYRKILIALVFFLSIYFLPQNIFSDNLEQADKYYEKYDYKFAIELYEKLMQKRPTLNVAQKLANCYRFINNTQAAENAYAKVLSFQDAEAINYRYYADALKQNAQFDLAKQNYLLYGQKDLQHSEQAKSLANSCDAAKMWAENPEPNVYVENELAMNSEYSEFSPVKYKSGYVFVSDRWFVQNGSPKNEKEVYGWTGNPYLKLYESTGEISPKVSLMPEPINADSHTGPAVFTSQGDTVYFSRSEADLTKKGKGKVVGHNYIYYSVKNGKNWNVPVVLPFNSNTGFSVQHPAISQDGSILYFTSDMPGGQGGTDIYASKREADGTWGGAVNCGTNVNSTNDEGFPSIGLDNRLYFSSKGHIGMGGLDVFNSVGSYKDFGMAENLKSPINSPKDDFGILFLSDQSGLISSNRNGGRGLDDIYKFSYAKPKTQVLALTIEGNVTDKNSGEALAGLTVHLLNKNTGKQVSTLSDEFGNFKFDLQSEQTYAVKGDDERFFTSQQGDISTIGIKESTIFAVKFELEHSNAVYVVRLNNIHYDFDKWNIRPDALSDLGKLVSFMKSTPDVLIEMRSHTDSRGTAAYNLTLSQKRAESTVAYLQNNGINSSRYTALGLGEGELLKNCGDQNSCNEAVHQENRRTEFKVIKTKSNVLNTAIAKN